jgi:hypothetical protein
MKYKQKRKSKSIQSDFWEGKLLGQLRYSTELHLRLTSIIYYRLHAHTVMQVYHPLVNSIGK